MSKNKVILKFEDILIFDILNKNEENLKYQMEEINILIPNLEEMSEDEVKFIFSKIGQTVANNLTNQWLNFKKSKK